MGLLASYIRLLIMSPNIKMSQRGNNYVYDKLNGFAKLICVHIYNIYINQYVLYMGIFPCAFLFQQQTETPSDKNK